MTTNVQDLPDRERSGTPPQNSIATFAGKINQVVADALSLYLKTKNFHWHVSGPHFRDYHLPRKVILRAIYLDHRLRFPELRSIYGITRQRRRIAEGQIGIVAPKGIRPNGIVRKKRTPSPAKESIRILLPRWQML